MPASWLLHHPHTPKWSVALSRAKENEYENCVSGLRNTSSLKKKKSKIHITYEHILYYEWQLFYLQLFTSGVRPLAHADDRTDFRPGEEQAKSINKVSILDLICTRRLRLGVQPRGGAAAIPGRLAEMCSRMEMATLRPPRLPLKDGQPSIGNEAESERGGSAASAIFTATRVFIIHPWSGDQK